MIRSKPSTDAYREAWERVFGASKWKQGDRVIWHAPGQFGQDSRFESCKCEKIGTITNLAPQSNGYVAVIGVQLDAGGVIDPSVDPDLLRPADESCPLGGGPLIPLGASVD